MALMRPGDRVYLRDDSGRGFSLPYAFPADGMSVHDAFGAGAANRLRQGSALVFRAEDHQGVDAPLFFGPYLRLEPGLYSFKFRGELDGPLRLRFTRNYSTEQLLETIVADFSQPVRLSLHDAADKFEFIGDRTEATHWIILRAIVVEREGDVAGDRAQSEGPAAGAVRSDDGRKLSLPLVWSAAAMRVHDAYGRGAKNRLRAGDSIVFDARTHGAIDEPALFFGPYFHFEPGDYSFRFRGALKGSMTLRFTRNFGAETLLEIEVETFDKPVRLQIEKPSDKVEIMGRRLKSTRIMTLSAIEISAGPRGAAHARGEGVRRSSRVLSRLLRA